MKDYNKEYYKNYYQKNKERIRKYQNENWDTNYYQKHKEKLREYQRLRYKKKSRTLVRVILPIVKKSRITLPIVLEFT
jgi:hypothetical protein